MYKACTLETSAQAQVVGMYLSCHLYLMRIALWNSRLLRRWFSNFNGNDVGRWAAPFIWAISLARFWSSFILSLRSSRLRWYVPNVLSSLLDRILGGNVWPGIKGVFWRLRFSVLRQLLTCCFTNAAYMLLVVPTALSLTISLTVRTNFEQVPLQNSLGTPRFQRNHQDMHASFWCDVNISMGEDLSCSNSSIIFHH